MTVMHPNIKPPHNCLVAISRNQRGKIFMFHFSLADVPAHKVKEYLEKSFAQCPVTYTDGIGLSFPAKAILELNEYGKPMRELSMNLIPELQFADKTEMPHIYKTRFAPNASQQDLLEAPQSDNLASVDNLTFDYNFKHNFAFDTAQCKAITVRNAVLFPDACRLGIKSAPQLQTMQIQGAANIKVDQAPCLKTVLIDLGDVWLPQTDVTYTRARIIPECRINLGKIAGCAIKVRYMNLYRQLHRSMNEFFSGNTLTIRDSHSVVIDLEESVSNLVLENCSDIRINCTGVGSIKDLEIKGCSDVLYNCTLPLASCAIVDSINVNIAAECFAFGCENSKVQYKGTLHAVSITKKGLLNLVSSSAVKREITIGNGSIVKAADDVRIAVARYESLTAQAYLNADVLGISYKDSREGMQILIINRLPEQTNANNLMRDYPHILCIKPSVPVIDALNRIFHKAEMCYFDTDLDFEDKPHIYLVCTAERRPHLQGRFTKLASKIKVCPDDMYLKAEEWLRQEGLGECMPKAFPFK